MIARVRTGTGREVLSTGKVLIGIRAQDSRPTQSASGGATLIQDALLASPDSHVLGSSFSGSRSVAQRIASGAPKPSLHRLGRGPIATLLRRLRWALLRMRNPRP